MLRTRVVIAGLIVVWALGGGLLAPYDPQESVGSPWQPPGGGFVLGTDVAGRDVLSRLLAGGRELTLVALAGAAIAGAVGVAGGLAAGWRDGRTSRWLTATADLLLAVPFLLLALLLAVALPAPAAVIAGTVCGGAPLGLRVARDLVRQVRHAGYVEAARCRGERPAVIMVREILPALAGFAFADLLLRFVLALQLGAAFGILGFGADPSAPDWGRMVRENLPGVALNRWALVAPALALTLLVLAALPVSARRSRPSRRTPVRWRPVGEQVPAGERRSALLQVKGLTVVDANGRGVVDGLGFDLAPGEVLALTGPSGCGKTSAVRGVLDVLEPGLRRVAGTVAWRGSEVRPGRAARRWRRTEVGLLDQDPAGTLNPLMSVGSLVLEGSGRTAGEARALLESLGLDAGRIWDLRPRPLSGGQAQRVALARALLEDPALLVLDEPTSGLDPQTLDLVVRVLKEPGRTALVITHDEDFASRVADRFLRFAEPPASVKRPAPESTPAGAPVLRVRELSLGHGDRPLIQDGELTLAQGEFVAVVGPSGSGKSTLLRALAGLRPPESGRADFQGRPLAWPPTERDAGTLRAIQFVGQDPSDALNPAHRIGTAIARPGRVFGMPVDVPELLERVGLDPALAGSRPGELSGGQRQRAALARALAARPAVLLADEITSALDTGTAAGLLDLLDGLRADGLALLLVTHDTAVAARADRVLRLSDHRLVRTENDVHAR
ncbi:ATP-binding cassette domain-containing protein [Actinocorallia populi]|uniref:ATP-binding cassette domain-containing protein n=1 Tax=Actinocorallia populi TaxID=2079200 RepID=UPI000D092B58|nr:ATP-binding cassette domain-containing protein [Actinocorallia populi]